MTTKLKNYINGRWTESAATEYLDVENPATGEVLAQVPLPSSTDMDTAAKHAQEAFRGGTSPSSD